MTEPDDEYTCKLHPWSSHIMIRKKHGVTHMCAACFAEKYEKNRA